MTFDESVFECQSEIIQVINKYNLPASIIILICENTKLLSTMQIQRTKKEEVILNVNQQDNVSDLSNNSES